MPLERTFQVLKEVSLLFSSRFSDLLLNLCHMWIQWNLYTHSQTPFSFLDVESDSSDECNPPKNRKNF